MQRMTQRVLKAIHGPLNSGESEGLLRPRSQDALERDGRKRYLSIGQEVGGVRWSRPAVKRGPRKVRAPQGRLPGNAWASKGDG